MADLRLNLKHSLLPKVTQRTVLLGRVKMAQAIHLPEGAWAKLLSDVEKDPLFREILGQQGIIRYRRFGRGGISNQFYEMQEINVAEDKGVSPETLLDQKRHLLKWIEKIGQEKFEKYFLYRQDDLSLEQIASVCGLTKEQASELQDFILDMSVQSEFYHPSNLGGPNIMRPTLIGRIVCNDDRTYSISFFSPHLARGSYEVNYSLLKKWQKARGLDRTSAAHLRKMLGVLELANLKQGAFWRTLEFLLDVQKEYFDSQDLAKMAPVSLRQVARRLQFAPSTISRVMASKSILLPWDREVFIASLMPGQRKVVLKILEKLLSGPGRSMTDMQMSKLVEENYGVRVSRRTITSCRHVLSKSKEENS